MSYLELWQVRKKFGDVVAVDQVTLSVEKGEFFTLLGPSGCGKTTLLRIVAGFESPDEGGVFLEGEDITGLPPNRRNMGMVFQAYSLFPNMTAEENVEFGLRVRGWAAAERKRRVAELLDLVGLSYAGKRYPHQLSGGEQQRVALARALAIEPRVLLLDEPLSALDAKIRVQLREEIRAIQRRLGITTLYVTHDQEEALALSDRVAVLSRGSVQQVGTPREIYERPATAFVASFVGTMNQLEGVVRDGERGVVEVGRWDLETAAARGVPAGTKVLVLVRPEVIRLTDAHDVRGGVRGRVVSCAFAGAMTRCKVELEGGGELLVDLTSVEARGLSSGVEVGVVWDPESVRVLVREAESGDSAERAYTP